MLSQNVALGFMMRDIIINILDHSEDPGYLSSYLTEQIKELIGCDTVVLVKCRYYLGKDRGEILKILPERNNNQKFREHILDFTKENHKVNDIQISFEKRFENDVLLMPLFSHTKRIGELVIVNPYEKQRYIEMKKLLIEMRELFALVLKNSYLFKELEIKVQERTKVIKEKEIIWRKLTSVAPVGIFRTDISGNLLFFNDKFSQITGIHKKDIVFSEIDLIYDLLKENIKDKEIYFKETDRWGYLQISSELDDPEGSIETYTGTLTDITERVKVENMLVQNEKMITMGELSAGIAHELNNPLSGIMQSVQNFTRRIDPENKKNRQIAEEVGLDLNALKKYIEKRKLDFMLQSMSEGANRCGEIVRNMLDFSRTNSKNLMKNNVNEILEKALYIADSDYDLGQSYDFRNIKIKKDLSKDPPIACCLENDLEQVFFNIIKNAAQALKDQNTKEPTILLRTRIMKDNVIIEIANNGTRPSKKQLKKMFEPFYTTKDPGKGTGLGLSVAKFIVVKKHHGDIRILDDNDLMTFQITLPI